jgi:two-component system LytT family sensor kinase
MGVFTLFYYMPPPEPVSEYLISWLISMADFIWYYSALSVTLLALTYGEDLVENEDRIAALQAQANVAQLNALRYQLNPHFLFNTLNGVSTLIDEDPPGARRMIARLSDLLRHTLSGSDEQEIPLARELEMLRLYLDIMEVRFQGKLEVSIETEASLDDALVPNLVLQPLVENAFRHGLPQMRTVGRVAVRAARDNGDLILTVRDNGGGPANPVREGVGLTNTRARLTQLYGARQGLALTADEGGGALVEVRFPYHTTPQRRSARNA